MSYKKDFNSFKDIEIQSYHLEQDRKEKANDELIQKEIRDRKREKKYNKEERDRYEKSVFDEFGFVVKEDYLIAQGFKNVVPHQCVRCKEFKALPYQFLNKFDKVNQSNICSKCVEKRSEQVKKCTDKNMFLCSCGIFYYCSSDRCMLQHENSDRHKNSLKRNRFVNGKKYNRDELRLLCSANKIPYYKSLKIEHMIDKLLELDNIKIPLL